MKKAFFLLAALVGIVIISHAKAKTPKPEVLAYYTGDGSDIEKYPLDKLTHIIYSFLHLKEDTIAFDNDRSEAALQKLVALKTKYPHLKIMISLGGWTGCYTCSPVFSKAESRQRFAASVARLMIKYNADGIDLDWEYPTIPGPPDHPYSKDDKANFTDLIVQLHKAMRPTDELSFAAGGFTQYLEESVDWAAIMPMIKRVNLMTYDLINGYSTQTGHHTALYSRPEQKESTDNCVQWLLKHGVEAKKLIIGAAFYARVWENVGDTSNGLYKSGKFKQGISYNGFATRLSADSGWVHYWDAKAKAPYSYHAAQKLFATYDNEKSLAEKVNYVKKYKLGGIMFWELRDDKYQEGLVDAIYKAL
jgi:chitinase